MGFTPFGFITASMATSFVAKSLFSCLIVLCASPMILSRSLNSQDLFHELGFDTALDKFHLKNNVGSSFRKVPSVPDARHNGFAPVPSKVSGDASLVGLSRNIDVDSSFVEVPRGSDPIHNPPAPSKVSGDASLVGLSRNIDVESSFVEVPRGSDPIHNPPAPSKVSGDASLVGLVIGR